VEGGQQTINFLTDIGLVNDENSTNGFQTQTGGIQVVETRGEARPRILSVEFDLP
jgi:hypothetical protein